MRFAFRISKWLHKYVGLLLLLFLAWMSLTGLDLARDRAREGNRPVSRRTRGWLLSDGQPHVDTNRVRRA